MFKALFRDRSLLLLLLLAVAVKLFSLNSGWVEKHYSTGVYPVIAKTFRVLFGWVPFSVGDVGYIAAFVWVVLKVWKLVNRLKRRQAKAHLSWMLFRKYLKLALVVYLTFSLLWGLNYDRQGIAKQAGLTLATYTVEDLFRLTAVLRQRLNEAAAKVDSIRRLQYNQNALLFAKGGEAYWATQPQWPFLAYHSPSIKPSLFTPVGHWFGFTGYYNPFSGEAQLKMDVPVFLKPFVVAHEVAHQLGYAKEDEASFVGHLACKASGDINFAYSTYFEMYRDALFECRQSADTLRVKSLATNLHARVKADAEDLQAYLQKNQNFIEPLMSGAYDRYLKLNNQPKGKATYNEVIAYLIAYMKKYGAAAI